MNTIMSQDTTEIFTQAVETHRRGDLSAAETLYREVIAAQPDNVDAEYLLGTALLQLGRFDEAILRLKSVVLKRPDVADVHNNLGIGHKAVGDWENAARAFESALKINPDYTQALFNLGAVMEHRGLFADAEKCYRRSLAMEPTDEETQWALAGVLKAQQKWNEAEAVYRAVSVGEDRKLDLRIQLAFVLARGDKLDEAAEIYGGILREQPDFAEIHNSLSFIHERQGKLAEAETSARKAIHLKPEFAEGYNNLGIALRSQHRIDDSLDAFRRAVDLNSGFALAAFNLGTTHLLSGDYAAGWPGYEKRMEALGLPPRELVPPRWNGEKIDGDGGGESGRLLVFSDQGFGDAIQFSRFLAETKNRSGANILFECRPQLVPVMQSLPEIDAVIPDGDDLPQFDRWIPLASLPGILGVKGDSLGDYPPVLHSAFELRHEIAERLSAIDSGRLTVGFVWRGNPEQARDAMRSCPLEKLRPLFEVDGAAFVSLQVDEGADSELNEIPSPVRPLNLGSDITDFAETAAVIQRLDLIITVDTATAHLAGSLGKETWTLLCHTPDWRWGLHGDRSLWYPTMRLFRQQTWGDWDGVVAEVRKSLMLRLSHKQP